MKQTANDIIGYMQTLQNEAQRRVLIRFFKTNKGEYGEGDNFFGLKVPQVREIVKLSAKDFPLEEIPTLVQSKWHEARLCGLLILVEKFKKAATKRLENDNEAIKIRDEIVSTYLRYAEWANNWDLVDMSAPKIIGHWLILPSNLKDKKSIMEDLAQSPNLWKNRISMVCTWKTTQSGDPSWALHYAEVHLKHPHDLMHKAVGWMLREVGKRIDTDLLRNFLDKHLREMHRTTLRYAIEKMDEAERKYWMER